MSEEKEKPLAFTALIELQVHPRWFELEARTRRDYARQLDELVVRYSSVRLRWFDAEAWTGRYTDFALCEFEDLDAYNSLWGELRRHPFLSTPFAHISRVVMGMELDVERMVADCATAQASPQQPPQFEEPEADPILPESAGEVEPEQPETRDEPAIPELSRGAGKVACPGCGKILKSSARFCGRCGAEIAERPSELPATLPAQTSSDVDPGNH